MKPSRIMQVVMLLVFSLGFGAVGAFAQDDIDTYEDKRIMFDHPADWTFCECDPAGNTAAIGNTETAASSTDLDDDEVQVLVIKSAEEFLVEYDIVEDIEGMSGEEILELFSQGSRRNFVEIEDTGSIYFLSPGEELDTLILVTPLEDDTFAMLVATARPGTLDDDDLRDQVIAIGATLRLPEGNGNDPDEDEPSESEALDDTFTSRDLTFDYPEDWTVEDNDGIIILVNNEDILEYENYGDLRRGEFILFIYPTLDVLNDATEAPFDEDSSSEDVAEYFLELSLDQDYEVDGDLETSRLKRRDLARYLATAEDHDQLLITLASEDGDDVITLAGFGEPGTLEDIEPVLMDLIATIEAR